LPEDYHPQLTTLLSVRPIQHTEVRKRQ